MGSAFRAPPQAPPLFTHTPETLLQRTQQVLDHSKALEDKIVAEVKPDTATFANTLLLTARDEDLSSLETHIFGFYQAVSTDAKLRDASTEADKRMSDFGIESSMREDVFTLIDAVYQRQQQHDAGLDAESRRLLEKERKSYINMGLGIPAGPQRDRFKQIKKRLSELEIVFQKTLNEDTGGIWLTPAELEGVPADVVNDLKKGQAGTPNEGKLWLTFKYPDYFPTVKYAKREDVRRRVYVANENKCPDNLALFKEAIELRDEAARLLGYPNHAAFRLEDKMAKTPDTVDEFLGDLRQRLGPGGKKEIEALKALKKATVGEAEHYFLWDHQFYNTLMLEKDYQLDQNHIAEWFPLQNTVDRMLNIFEELFGLQFVEIQGEHRGQISSTGKGDDIVWHEDVKLFAVWDDEAEGAGFVGYLYLDLFPRDGKYPHAANFNLQPGFINADGTRRYPATALVCNFSKPTPKKPSLLKHDEVVTLFHELGHGIHDLVSRTKYSRFHGTSVVRDFVEAPSQMLENWCWTPSQIKALSQHWSYSSPDYLAAWKEQHSQASDGQKSSSQPSRELPDEIIKSIISTQHVNDALFNLRQLHFGIFDMTVHEGHSHAAVVALDPSATYNQLRRDITQIEGPEAQGAGYTWGHGQTTFGHLIGGYDAGYYGYLFSKVYSMDMFYSVFQRDPMDPKEGRRYRHTVLERGGAQDEMQTLEDFLGRKPSTEAFYKDLGLS